MPTKRFTLIDGIFFLIWAIPAIYLAVIYSSLPEQVPLHFNSGGQPDRFGARSAFLWYMVLLQVVSVGVYFLIRFLPEIDPKKKIKYSRRVLTQISYAVITFMAALSVFVIYGTVRGHLNLNTHYLYAAIALLMAYLGNLFNNLKPNYFVGIRTPWTLENETVWKKTHQLGGRLWLGGGLILALACMLAPGNWTKGIFAAGIAILVLVPVVYSYLAFKKIAE
ncbi:MAG TPA: SdpI family protein [Puia sp.]|nr:SdpI family protein [Puia sp.]